MLKNDRSIYPIWFSEFLPPSKKLFFKKNLRNWKELKNKAIKMHLFWYSNSYPSFFEKKISASLNWSFAQNLLLSSLPDDDANINKKPKKQFRKFWKWQSTLNRKLDTIFLLRFVLEIWILEKLDNFTRYYSSKYQPTAQKIFLRCFRFNWRPSRRQEKDVQFTNIFRF